MADKKIIAVLGATGAQGGGLVRAIMEDTDGGFTARALTRNPDSEKARELAALGAEVVIPGHGTPTNMDEVTKYTKGYLSFMRKEVGALIENGGDLADVSTIDQSAYAHLDTYDELAALNASMIFRAMEFE